MIPHQAATRPNKRHEQRRDTQMQKRKREKGREGTSEEGGYAGCSVCLAGKVCASGIAGRRLHVVAEQAPLWWAHKKGGGGPRQVLTYRLRHIIAHQAATRPNKRHAQRRGADAEAKEREGREGTSEACGGAGCSVLCGRQCVCISYCMAARACGG